MTKPMPILDRFEAVDELSRQVEEASAPIEVQSSELSVGALAEVLILRSSWRGDGRDVRIKGAGDARHAAISAVTKNLSAGSAVGPSAGAFHIVGSGEALDLSRHEFAAAAGRLAQESGMPVSAARVLKGAFSELMENVGQHAGIGTKGLAIYELTARSIAVAVADSGQGIVKGYLTSQPDLAGLGAMDALEWAVRQHRSRFTEPGRGTGFSTVVRAMRTMDAALRVRSDDASIEIEGVGDGTDWVVRDQPSIQGFVVSLQLNWR